MTTSDAVLIKTRKMVVVMIAAREMVEVMIAAREMLVVMIAAAASATAARRCAWHRSG